VRRLAGAPAIAAGFAVLGAWVVWHARGMTYDTPVGPGPGFFPHWLGLLLIAVSLGALVEALRQGSVEIRPVIALSARREIAVTLVAVAAFALGVERAGFAPVTFAVLLALLLARGCRPVPTALGVALAGSLGVGYAFTRWLGVFLPPAPFGLLAPLGL
jgi:putative tricarboxylic transport membrane protein